MSHWVIAPILWPFFTAAMLAWLAALGSRWVRPFSAVSMALLLAVAVELFRRSAAGETGIYLLGNWRAPFGIVLMADRLAALMVLLTALVGGASLMAALAGEDREVAQFHALFHFQLAGINGAFLTADLFSLFVFFELLLIASYGLLLQGGGRDRLRAGFSVIAINLTGSALFLVAATLLYNAAGSLNMADLAAKLARLAAQDQAVASAGLGLLVLVFALKAAVLPVHFWLPGSYTAATASVAALFAILTKVGIYGILRITSLLGDGPFAGFGRSWLLASGLATLLVAALGAFAASRLRTLAAYLVMASAGTLLTAISLRDGVGIAGALFYLAHSSLLGAAAFLLAGVLRRGRGEAGDGCRPGPALDRPLLLGSAFFLAAMALAGLPPSSGFVGKLLILRAAVEAGDGGLVLAVVLTGGFLVLAALARAGSTLFWHTADSPVAPADKAGLAPVAVLLAASLAMVALAAPLHDFTLATAQQLSRPQAVIDAVLGQQPVPRWASGSDAIGQAPDPGQTQVPRIDP